MMVRTLVITVGLAASGLFWFVAKPQTSPNTVPVQAIITVEAQHTHGYEVPELQPGDVMAYERRDRLPVTELVALQGENAGVQLFVLIDDSSDWTLGAQFADLHRFIETQPAATAIGVGYMRNGTVEMRQDFTTDHSRASGALRVPFSSGEASPYLSLSDLIKRWPPTTSRRAVVMVTSGIDSLGGLGLTDPYLDTAIEDAQRHEIVVYAIYMPATGHSSHSTFRMNWGQSHLAQLGEETGGEAYMLGFGAPVALEPYLDDIAAHLTHQYRVTFLITPGDKSGFRDVRFKTEAPNAVLVAASKVYVPAAAK